MSPWPTESGQQFANDLRLLNSRHTNRADRHVVVSFHLADEQEQACAGYWVPFDRGKRFYLPRFFGAYVYRSSRPCVALVIEPRGRERRLDAVQVVFEWMDGNKVVGHEMQRVRAGKAGELFEHQQLMPVVKPWRHVRRKDFEIPLDRWVRAAAWSITLEISGRDPVTGNRVGHYPFESKLPIDAALKRGVAIFEDAAPTPRRETKDADIEQAAAIYRAEMERHRTEGGRARPVYCVEQQLGLTSATAKRRIKEARKRGMLGPALKTRAGEGSTEHM